MNSAYPSELDPNSAGGGMHSAYGSGVHGYYGDGSSPKIKEGVLEADDSPHYTELPGRDLHGATYPYGGSVEMDPRGRPAELSHHAAPAELDATPSTAGVWR